MDDKIDIQFEKPVFVQGEMPTSNKLNDIATKFEQASDQILRATGNTYYRNICNIAAILGDSSLLSNVGSMVPAVPAVFQSGNKLLNRLNVTVGTYDPDYDRYPLAIDSTKGYLKGTNTVYTDEVINIVIAAVSKATNTVTRVYEGTFIPPDGTTTGQNLTSLYFRPGTTEALFGTDISDATLQMVILAPNQDLISTLMQALVNLGNLTFPSATGYIADQSGTIETYTSPRSVTDEIEFIENKYFYTHWRVTVRKGDGVVPNPAWIGTDPAVGYSRAWNTSTWVAASCSPSPTVITQLLALGAQIPSVQRSNTTCYVKSGAELTTEIESPNVLRARVYTHAGVPLVRSDGAQVFACFEAAGHGGLPTVYIADEDQGTVAANENFTIMIPIALPMRLMRGQDYLVNNMANLWPTMITNVIGGAYSATPMPLPIDERLKQCEANMNILATAINDLTVQEVTLS